MPMSLHARFERYGPAIFVWAIVVFAGFIKSGGEVLRGTLPGNDDYMRLTQVRDWLGGQAWGDPVQARMFPADPLISHWSRFSDILIGGLIKVFTPVLGAAEAETAALFVLPAALFLMAILLVVKTATLISKAEWVPLTAAMTAGLCYPVFYQFFPGRIDHHGLQIVLALAAAYAIIRSEERPNLALIAGAFCGLSLWVGIESAPYVAAACAAISVNWALSKAQNAARPLMLFGLSLAAVTAFCLLISPAQSRAVAACDAISPVFAVLTAAIAMAMMAAALLDSKIQSPLARLVTVSAMGLTAAGVTLAIYPQCLRGPYSELDPRLVEVWLSNVSEAKPFHKTFGDDVMISLSLLMVPVIALFGMFFVKPKDGIVNTLATHTAARTLIIFMGLTALTGLIQTRMFSFSGALGAPLAALFIAHMAAKADRFKSDLPKALSRVGILALLSPLFIPAIIGAVFPADTLNSQIAYTQTSKSSAPVVSDESLQITCDEPASLRALKALPAGLVITQIDLGAPLLAAGPHSATTAPYHRNQKGLMVTLNAYMSPPETAMEAIAQLDADYLIACKTLPETNLFSEMAPDSLLAGLVNGAIPNGLKPVILPPLANGQDNPLMVFEILSE